MRRARKLVYMATKDPPTQRKKVKCLKRVVSPVPQGNEREVELLSNILGDEFDLSNEENICPEPSIDMGYAHTASKGELILQPKELVILNENDNCSPSSAPSFKVQNSESSYTLHSLENVEPRIILQTKTNAMSENKLYTSLDDNQKTCQHEESMQCSYDTTLNTSPSVQPALDSTHFSDNTTDASNNSTIATTSTAEIEKSIQAPWLEVQLLAVDSANINLESPASDFTIPTPQSSAAGSPAMRKRKSVQKQRPGKIRPKNILHWEDYKRKLMKNKGKSYTTRKGNIVEQKMKKPPCECNKKCSDHFESNERQEIFNRFWKLGSQELQWLFVSKYVSTHKPKRIKSEGPNKTQVMTYTLPKQTDDEVSPVVVCRTMFLNTLSISTKTVQTVFKKLQKNNNNVDLSDMRGRHRNRPHKRNPNIVESAKDHLLSLAPIESHYCRKYSTKYYLDGQLSYTRLHQLYKDWFQPEKYGQSMATARQYQDIINENFNIAFYKPKKDQCDKCHAFYNISEPSDEQKNNHENHLRHKELARAKKEMDKHEAQESQGKIITACFDMQKIISCPHGNVGFFYYKRKLNLYNFTVYDVTKKQGFCYMWTETKGKKGANEISSGLQSFMTTKIEEGAKEFRFWSDNCSGQNRNRIVFAMYQNIIEKNDIKSITHRFLEVGHTQSEGDSVHSVIEGAAKNRTIYTPDQWYNLIRWAKTKGDSYRVKEMTLDDILDYHPLLNGKNWLLNDDGQKVQWTKIKEVHITKENLKTIKYKYELYEDYKTLTTEKQKDTRKSKTKSNIPTITNVTTKAHTESIKIKNDKYKDLMSLCTSNIIPEEFHQFFKTLPHEMPSNTDSAIIDQED